jgi:Lipopolysaccharide-assembly
MKLISMLKLSVLMRSVCLVFGVILFSQCYSFRGVSIDPETKTYSVNIFTNSTSLAPPTLAQTFTQQLKDKIRNNTRLNLINTEGADLTFSGQVVGYDVSSVSPQPNQPAQFNQLRIAIEVEMTDAKNEKASWKQTFTFQADFPGSGQLLDFQDQLIKTISTKLLEDIFNKAFTENW